MLNYKKLFKKNNRFVAYVSGSDVKRHFLYNSSRTEMQLDIMWAFMYGNATKVSIANLKNSRKAFKTFNSLAEVQEEWEKVLGKSAHYMVWYNRIKTKEI